MRSISNKETHSTRKYWFILLFYFLIFSVGFIFDGKVNWLLILSISTVITVFCSMTFWQIFIFPDLNFSDQFILSKHIIFKQILASSLITTIRNGEIMGDYIFLKKKPNIHAINIDQKSAVLITDSSNHTSLFLHGFHLTKKNPKIIGAFYLGIRILQFGPESERSFEPKKVQETLTEYHSRISSVEQTKTQCQSGEFIIPSFSVIYNFEMSGRSNKDLDMFLNLTKSINADNSSAASTQNFENHLINEILDNWRIFCKNKKREDILTIFPGEFDSKRLRFYGIKLRIFINNVY
jgi:hypothetical protein